MGIFSRKQAEQRQKVVRIWARPEMFVTFRAEIMPGKDREARTYKVKQVLRNGRVTLYNFPDEHRESSFEPINFLKNVTK